AGRCRSGCGGARTSGTGGKRDAGCGMGSLVCERGSRRRGRARRRRAQAPRRRGGAMTGSGVATVATVGRVGGIHRGPQDVLRARFGMQELVLGYDHGFGRGRAGDVEMVRRLAREDGFAMDVVPAVTDDGQAISSSLIRTAVAHGDLASAERGLGRPYSLRAVVERGAGRGRTIGVPTINLTSPDPRQLLPPDGVYAVRGEVDGTRSAGMMNQGPRPTFGVHARGLEIHLFAFSGDLYGVTVTVEWVRRLRDTRTFPSRQALVDQIERDAVAARAVLKG